MALHLAHDARRRLITRTLALALAVTPMAAKAEDYSLTNNIKEPGDGQPFHDGLDNAAKLIELYRPRSVLIMTDGGAEWLRTARDATALFENRRIKTTEFRIQPKPNPAHWAKISVQTDNFNYSLIYCMCPDNTAKELANFVKVLKSGATVVGANLRLLGQ